MAHKSTHEKVASSKLTFVVLSDPEKPSRTFQATKLQLLLLSLILVVIIGAIVTMTLVYTPMGRIVMPNFFATQQEQIDRLKNLESKIHEVENQIAYLSSYNIRLRRALGENVSARTDSIVSRLNDQLRVRDERPSVQSTPATRSQTFVTSSMSTDGQEMSGDFLPFIAPVSGFESRGINYSSGHLGVDFSARAGEPIVAPADGIVIFADWTLLGGNTLFIAHPGNFLTIYKHCERILVNVGSRVTRGEAVALVGSTGITSGGPHLHFEIWRDGKNLNPDNYLLMVN
jgi:murein DD-endopeptidase MepM/ murein hydrolase activator NlpD